MSPEDVTPNPAEPPSPRRAPRFDVEPYRPDGVAPPGGLALLVGGVLGTAAALGFVLGFVEQWFYLIIVFPVVAGALLGAAGRGLVRAGRVRSPAVAGAVAALGGVAMMFFMHYFCYLRDLPNINRKGASPPSVFEYIDLEAQVGVVIGENGANEINLGYIGSYLYFAVETALAAGFALAIARGPALDPFCRNCNEWKTGRTLAGLPHVPPHVAVEAVQSGALLDLLETGVPLGGGYNTLFLKVFLCPRCGGEGTVVAAVESVTTDSRGRRYTKLLGRTVYPGEVLPLIDDYTRLRPPIRGQSIAKDADNNSPETRGEDIRPA